MELLKIVNLADELSFLECHNVTAYEDSSYDLLKSIIFSMACLMLNYLKF